MGDSDDGLGILLLVVAFNSIVLVGPVLRFFYDAILWCNERMEGSGNDDNNRQRLTNWCTEGMETDCVDDLIEKNHEEEAVLNNLHNVDNEAAAFNNAIDITSSPSKGKGSKWMKGSEMKDLELVDDENYIMKSPSSSFSSSNRLDESLSDSSNERNNFQGTYNLHI